MKINFFIFLLCVQFAYGSENELFEFNQSTIQAFYFVIDANIYGEPLEKGEDWLVAYHNDICIGARKWNGPYTDVPLMGDDGSPYSKGYIKSGDLPTFKIYDKSVDMLYDATPSEQIIYPKGMVGMIQLKSLTVGFNDDDIILNKPEQISSYGSRDYQIINGYKYKKPKPFSFITALPNDLKEYGKIVFNKNYLKEFAGISLITGFLIYYDEDLIKKSRFLHDEFNISYTDQMKIIAEPLEQPIRVPGDLGSALYFIGDGWTHFGLSMSFYLAGKFQNNNRALQTSSQILQGMISAGFVTQILKHITGRTSPFKAVDWDSPENSVNEWNKGNNNVKDRWEFFPSQIKYHEHVSSYDAFPSGHLAVCMSTFTVITENYPEYPIIKPIGYTLMTLLSIQMMNNGVHWASDYPLSIAMGYYLGKIAVKNGRESTNGSTMLNYKIEPYVNSKFIGLNLTYYFN